MNIYLGEKIKSLRIAKGISQEKLAQYLNVSFQAVSKWENSSTYPDITLLPEISRFFGITVDELLQTEKIDEQRLFTEYEQKACELFRDGDMEAHLAVWKEAYHAMPNNLAVKEMLMSAYFDADKIKYKQEIIEIGTELYHSTLLPDAGETETYYRGQAISQLSKTYAVNGDSASAEKWAVKASYLMHAQEFLFSEITSGKDLLTYFRFANHWYFKKLLYMCCRVAEDGELSKNGYGQAVIETLEKLYEVVYPNGDMEFEMMSIMCTIHSCAAEYEAIGSKNEDVVCTHLTKALQFAEMSVNVKKHSLNFPLIRGMEIEDAPTDNKQIVRRFQSNLSLDSFMPYKDKEWFKMIEIRLNDIL